LSKAVYYQTFTKDALRNAEVLTGVTPEVLRRVFAGWMLFAAIVGVIVSLAPGLSMSFIVTTLVILLVFTVAMFAQSRISEGWPSIIMTPDAIGVVTDPQKRAFLCISRFAVDKAEPATVRPNRRAIAVLVKADYLDEDTVALLREGVWPRDDRLIGLIYYKARNNVCQYINEQCARTSH